jgi:magnesium-transporting ATPase (P-type)
VKDSGVCILLTASHGASKYLAYRLLMYLVVFFIYVPVMAVTAILLEAVSTLWINVRTEYACLWHVLKQEYKNLRKPA